MFHSHFERIFFWRYKLKDENEFKVGNHWPSNDIKYRQHTSRKVAQKCLLIPQLFRRLGRVAEWLARSIHDLLIAGLRLTGATQ